MAASPGQEFLPRRIAEAFIRTLGAEAVFTEDVEVDAQGLRRPRGTAERAQHGMSTSKECNMSDIPMIRCGTVATIAQQVQERAARITAGLGSLGIAAGDNVAIMMANSVEFLEVTAGIALTGANPVPVNWHWKSEELGYLLSNSASTAAFVHADFVAAVEQTGTSVPLIVVSTGGTPATGRARRLRGVAGWQQTDRRRHCPVRPDSG